MKWPCLLLLATSGLAGCYGTGPAVDPFLGRQTVPPPGTGQIAPPSVSIPYYQGNPPPGAPPAMTAPQYQYNAPPGQYNAPPAIGPTGSTTPQRKLGRLLAETPGDREYRVGRVRLAADLSPVQIVPENHKVALAAHSADVGGKGHNLKDDSETQLASATRPQTAEIETRAGAEAPVRIPDESARPATAKSTLRDSASALARNDRSAPAGRAGVANVVSAEPQPFAAPRGAIEIADLPQADAASRQAAATRASASDGLFRPAFTKSNLARPTAASISRSSASSDVTPGESVDSSRQPDSGRFGHAVDYGWVKGKLEYLQSKKQWKLRYIPIDGETDEYGGSVILDDKADLRNYRPGDFVALQGELDAETTEQGTYAPLYRVADVKRIVK